MISTPRFFLLSLAGLLSAPLGLLAQGPAAPPAAAKPGAAAYPAKAAAAANVDPAVIEILRKSFEAQRAKGTFRARMESTGPGGVVMPSAKLEFVFPNRLHMNLSGLEVVGVGDKIMIKVGDAWMPAPANMKQPTGEFSDPKKVDELLGKATYAKSLGQTKIGELVVDSYELHTKTKDIATQSKFYISPAENLVQRVETQSDVKGKQMTSTLTYFDYGAPIQIELPK